MNIETKFKFNDTVYPITHGCKKIVTVCNVCKGTGTVSINGNGYRCPECFGDGENREYKKSEWYVATGLVGKIGKIALDLYNNKRYGESTKRYMLTSTGIGSGTLWDEEDIFLTFNEAQEECDKRNKIIEE